MSRLRALVGQVGAVVRAVQENDESHIEEAIVRLSRSRRVFAPLGLALGAVLAIFSGMKVLLSNWRLTLVQVLPALWIWLAMFDLKQHVLHDRTFDAIRGPILIPIWVAIVGITVASFFLNAVFAFAIAQEGRPEVRPAVARARERLVAIAISGAVVGVLLAAATTLVSRAQPPWFVLSLGIVIGVMMVSYVAVPARLIGGKPPRSRRDRLMTSVTTGFLSAAVSTPSYITGRIGILMLGSSILRIPGFLVLVVSATMQAGATGAVRAIKMSASLATGGAEQPERQVDSARP